MVLNPKQLRKLLRKKPKIRAVFISGGGRSVYEKGAPQPPKEIFKLKNDGTRVPVHSICYGMQWTTRHFGGKVQAKPGNREYGRAGIEVLRRSQFFRGTPKRQTVWASHGDSVVRAPGGFVVTARNKTQGISAMEDPKRRIWATLFHPEVSHTPFGKQMLSNFLFKIAGCKQDWKPASMIEHIQQEVLMHLRGRKAVLGFSGGVDSTTLAATLSPVLGRRLVGVVVDGGQLRLGELDEIRRNAKAAGIRIIVVSARRRMMRALRGVADPERKRKVFRRVYTETLVAAARRLGTNVVIQGTLATDMIESGVTGGEVIKTHHNVGIKLLRGWLALHPFGHLFKYEVRALARKLGLAKSIWNRQPFPGPGLIIRCVGAVTLKRLDRLRWADAEARRILVQRKEYNRASQVAISDVGQLVGVKGDQRVHGANIMIRGLKTIDFMTGDGVRFSRGTKAEIERVLTQHSRIVGVTWNEMDKPPCTTEPE
jgi:GMP synthase (glutamine-hydrolysing)